MNKSRTYKLTILLAAMALVAVPGAHSALADGGQSDAGGVQAVKSGVVYVKRGDRGRAVRLIQRKLRLTVDGIFGKATESAVKRFQRRKDLTPDGVVGPETRKALHLRPFAHSSVHHGGTVKLPAALKRIAKCESGGDPTAVSKDGKYRGKYQFTLATWHHIGGKGDPVDASEATQDRLALKLYRSEGTDPWPTCAQAA
jgi:Transglycosylase-like domain/Putative peptidoglycan binding domain